MVAHFSIIFLTLSNNPYHIFHSPNFQTYKTQLKKIKKKPSWRNPFRPMQSSKYPTKYSSHCIGIPTKTNYIFQTQLRVFIPATESPNHTSYCFCTFNLECLTPLSNKLNMVKCYILMVSCLYCFLDNF